jgi:AAA domain
MNENKASVETLEAWLNRKPYWERHLWKLNFEKELLTSEDIEACYADLCEHLDLSPPSAQPRKAISFQHIPGPSNVQTGSIQIRLKEIKNLRNVNALSQSCILKFGNNLTLVYGANGSGKSGIGRLLCNACFSRGEREILPDVRSFSSDSIVSATFTIDDGFGGLSDINYQLGDNQSLLRRFSVFDAKSVLIHLDQANNVNFTPSQVIIFDRVASTVAKLEEKLTNERNARKRSNPFETMFLDGATSSAATFCKGISGTTDIAEFLKYATFDEEIEGKAIEALSTEIEEKRKLDIPKRKAQLSSERQNLEALRASLEAVMKNFSAEAADKANRVIADILEKKNIVETLGAKSFDDGMFRTIGTSEWKSLIMAASRLYESEKRANGGQELTHCLLCHQELSSDSQSLFSRYWEFLKSRAETELSEASQKQGALLRQPQRPAKRRRTQLRRFQRAPEGIRGIGEFPQGSSKGCEKRT